jgi:hypothetical protein
VEETAMDEQERGPASQQGDGQPENIEELESATRTDEVRERGRGASPNTDRTATEMEGAMGGTSDAGTAADDAAEAAAMRRGLEDDSEERE